MSVAKILLIGALSLFVIFKGIVPAWNEVNSDFGNYYVAARLIQTHDNLDSIYNDRWFHSEALKLHVPAAMKFSPFPPITAFVMTPLAFMRIENANRIWLILNCLLFIPGVWVVRKITSWSLQDSLLFILLSGLSLINNLRFGQLYWLMTIVILFAIWAEERKPGPSGVALGLFAWIKYFPVIFIAGSFFRGNYKMPTVSMVTISGLLFFQVGFFGFPLMTEYLTQVLAPHLSGHLSSQDSFAFEFQSWESLLLNLFCPGSPYFEMPLINMPMLKTIVKWLISLVIIAPVVFIFIKSRNRSLTNELQRIVYFALPSLATLVLLPASATYHFILLLVPVSLLLSSKVFPKPLLFFSCFLFVAIGFIPYHVFFELGSTFALFAYPRLMLITALYFISTYMVVRELNQQLPVNA